MPSVVSVLKKTFFHDFFDDLLGLESSLIQISHHKVLVEL